jgi:hypothetical protein
MIKATTPEAANKLYVKLFSLLVAALLSLTVTSERPGQTRLTVPVHATHLPAGLRMVSPPPAAVEVTVAGPKILLLLLPWRDVSCEVDLTGAAAGTTIYLPQEGWFDLPDRDLKVVRVSPESVRLTLQKM